MKIFNYTRQGSYHQENHIIVAESEDEAWNMLKEYENKGEFEVSRDIGFRCGYLEEISLKEKGIHYISSHEG